VIGGFALPGISTKLLALLSAESPGWLAAGGRFTHAIWHLMVLAGVACHFMAVHSTLS
jgi:hypothetical protein